MAPLRSRFAFAASLLLLAGVARADFITSDTTPPMPGAKSDIPGSTCGTSPNHLRCSFMWNQLRSVWLARKPWIVNWEARIAKLKDSQQPGACGRTPARRTRVRAAPASS